MTQGLWTATRHTHIWAFSKLLLPKIKSTQLCMMCLYAIALQYPFTGTKRPKPAVV